MIRETARRTVLGIRNRNQSQIGLTPDDQRFDGMRIQLDGFGRELNFCPEVRSLKRGFELLFRPQHRLGFSIGFDREHPDACGFLLGFSKLSAKMLIFLLELTKMSSQLGFGLMAA